MITGNRRRSHALCLSEVAALNMSNQLAYNIENELDEEYNAKETEKPSPQKTKFEKMYSCLGCLYTI